MTKNPFPNSLSERSQRISGLHERLGTTHFGIDTEIQQVLDAFVPWYQFAETQDRPRTIGLWGMTGTGKSSLVRELVKEAGLEERTFWLDAGECRDKYWLDKYFDQLEEDLDGQPFIVVVDEFQHARTIDQGARELSEPGMLRRFWELLDAGRVVVWPDGWRSGTLDHFYRRLKEKLENGMVVRNGKIIKEARSTEDTEDMDLGPYFEGALRAAKVREPNWVIPEHLWDDVREAHIGTKPTQGLFMEKMAMLDGPGALAWIEELLKARMVRRVVDASKALIIVLGNLDELYVADKEPIAELHPDVLLHRHRNIGRSGVQQALLKLFRIEQVGRMGTSHVVFPPIGQATINQLVKREVGKHMEKLTARCGRPVELDTSLMEHLSTTSAIAVLGARPVVQAVHHTVPHLLSQALAYVPPGSSGSIRLAVKDGRPVAWIGIIANLTQEVDLSWPVGYQGKGMNSRAKRERIAAHEAGHLLCGTLLAGKKPLQACASTRDIEVGGFVVWDQHSEDEPFLRSDILPELASLLGGWAAERILYGAHGVSEGSTNDLRKATGKALYWAKKTAFGHTLMQTAEYPSAHDIGFRGVLAEAEDQAKEWILAGEKLALETLDKHSALFHTCRKLLMEHGSLDMAKLAELFSPSDTEAEEGIAAAMNDLGGFVE